MILTHLSDSEVLSCTVALIGERRRITALLVAHLAEVEQRRLHLRASYSSLFDFCINKLRMGKGATWRHVNGAKLAQRYPVVLDHLREGSLYLSGLELLQRYLTPDNCTELFAAAAGKTTEEIRTLLAARFPRPDVPDRILPADTAPLTLGLDTDAVPSNAASPAAAPRGRVQPLSETRYLVQFTASEAVHQKIERVLDLMSHSNPARELSVVVERALDLLVAKLEREKQGKTSRPRKSRGVRPGDISAETRRIVTKRDGWLAATFQVATEAARGWGPRAGRGVKPHREPAWPAPTGMGPHESRDAGERSTKNKSPRGLGGAGDEFNITTRCFGHNKLAAEDVYGREFVAEKAAASKSKSKPESKPESERSSGTGNHLRYQRRRTEQDAEVFDKLEKALVGLGFRRKEATAAVERVSRERPLAETPLAELVRQTVGLLTPPAASTRSR